MKMQKWWQRERERDTSRFRGTPFSDTDAGRFVPKLNWNSCIECCALHFCLWLLDGPSAGPLWETRCSWNGVEHGRAVNVGTGPSTWVVGKQKHATKGIGQLHLMFHHWVLSLEQHIHSTTWRLRPKKFSKPMLLGLNWHGKWWRIDENGGKWWKIVETYGFRVQLFSPRISMSAPLHRASTGGLMVGTTECRCIWGPRPSNNTNRTGQGARARTLW